MNKLTTVDWEKIQEEVKDPDLKDKIAAVIIERRKRDNLNKVKWE